MGGIPHWVTRPHIFKKVEENLVAQQFQFFAIRTKLHMYITHGNSYLFLPGIE